MEVYPPPMPYQICKIEELRKVSKWFLFSHDLSMQVRYRSVCTVKPQCNRSHLAGYVGQL